MMNMPSSLYINGQQVEGDKGQFSVVNPATGAELAACPQSSTAQVDAAVKSAADAFPAWRDTSHEERKQLLQKVADVIEANAEELAKIVTLEQGKPFGLAQMELGGAVAWTRYTAALDIPVKVLEDSDERRVEMHAKPLGVVASITPWNWPLMITIWHIIPALRAGNTLVIKPSEYTPFNVMRLIELIGEVLPAGVVNVVTGAGEVGGHLVQHPQVKKVTFTGSTKTGQAIMRSGADTLKRLTLELGGNDAGIMLPGTDVKAVAEGIFITSFLNMGQTCAALKRLYVHESQYQEVCDALVEIANQQVVGSGMDEGVNFGPVQNKAQLEIVESLVDDAVANGAEILCGGKRLDQPGYFYPPTIVAGVKDGFRIVDEEQFGPALPIVSYSSVGDVIAAVNASPNGLGNSVWGSDIAQAQEVAGQLESGTVWINNHAEVLPHCPFGGCKMSGFGVAFGEEGLMEYTRQQVVNVKA